MTSFCILELCTRLSINKNSSTTEEHTNGNRMGIISIVTSLGFASQAIFDFLIPISLKGQNYFVFKVFYNNLVYLIIIPSVVIACITKLSDYFKHYLKTMLEIAVLQFGRKPRNRITPVNSNHC